MNTKPLKGLRSFYPTEKGPIDTYQLGKDGRIEYIGAEIGTDHLSKGVDTTEEWKKWAKERGSPADVPGLIISKRLGGSGIDPINLFPKSPALDKTNWGVDEEVVYNEASDMKKWKKIKFYVKFEYPDVDSLRPSKIEYQYELPSGKTIHNKVTNEIVDPASAPGEGAAEDEEEYEYEYEYEEDDEEEGAKEAEIEFTEISKPEEPQQSQASSPPQPIPALNKFVEIPTAVQDTVLSRADIPPSPPSSSPPSSFTAYLPDPPKVEDTGKEEFFQPKPEPPKAPETQKSAAPTAVSEKGGKLFTASDFIEMLPVIGSIKLAFDTFKAIFAKDVNRAFWKAIQCGISALGDFHFLRAFARHGRILVKPITEKTLVGFANKAEPQIIIFGACKAGNQVLSSLKRILSSS